MMWAGEERREGTGRMGSSAGLDYIRRGRPTTLRPDRASSRQRRECGRGRGNEHTLSRRSHVTHVGPCPLVPAPLHRSSHMGCVIPPIRRARSRMRDLSKAPGNGPWIMDRLGITQSRRRHCYPCPVRLIDGARPGDARQKDRAILGGESQKLLRLARAQPLSTCQDRRQPYPQRGRR